MRPFKHIAKTQFLLSLALGLTIAFTFSPIVFGQITAKGPKRDVLLNQEKEQSPLDVRSTSLIENTTTNQTAAGPKFNQLDKSSLGGPVSFGSGFNSATPEWEKWQSAADAEGPEYENAPQKVRTPLTSLGSLDPYKTSPNENGFIIAAKMDDMVRSLSPVIVDLSSSGADARDLPQYMMGMADQMVARTNGMYSALTAMYNDIDNMKTQLGHNYENYNASDRTQELADKFNAKSDEMANRVASMRKAAAGMLDRVGGDRELLDGMFDILDRLNGSAKSGDSEKIIKHIKDVSARFEIMAKDLKAQGLEADKSVEEVRQYLNNLTEYVKNTKTYNQSAIDFTLKVRKYLQDIKNYFDKVFADLQKTDGDLKANEDYFRNSKVEAGGEDAVAPENMNVDACAALSQKLKKHLTSMKECQKSCHTVCRQQGKGSGVEDCFECPSGSPDSCADVGGQPSNFSWCQPGGFCYDDPNMVCVPFGAKGPQGEHLQCTNCKERPDECWQNVGPETTNLTHCVQRCWDGVCVYKGKYKNLEWDGKPEFMHCYACKTPPGPPSCEDLGWGTTWKSDCEKTCKDPDKCEKVNTKIPGGPNPNPNPPPGNQPPGGGQQGGGQCGGGVCGGVVGGGQTDNPQGGGQTSGGHTVSGGKPQGGGTTEGNNPTPPTGGVTPPTGGGATIAGGTSKPSPTPTPAPSGTPAPGNEKPGAAPTTTSPQQPQQPNTGDKPKPPDPPPQPPTNPDIEFYQKWLTEVKARIKSREDIINNPNEGTTVRDEAQKQLDGMKWWENYLQDRIKKLQDEELAKQQAASDFRKKQEEYERTRPRTRDYAEEARRRGLEWKLNRLKTATDALKNKLQEMKDAITGRKEHLDRIKNEITQLQNENNHFTVSRDQNGMDKDHANTRIKQNEERIKYLQGLYNDLAKKLQEAQKKFAEELEPLKTEYQRALWSVDEGSRRRAEAQRMDEYFEKWDELTRKEQMRKVRNDTFDSMVKGLEGARDEARSRGDTSAADEFQRQIDNIRRGQAEWDASQEKQINTLKDQIRDIQNRNMYEGVGPGSPEELGKKLGEYGKMFQDQLTAVQGKISELEKMGGTRTAEQNNQLDALKAQAQGLQGAIDGVNAKQQVFTSGDKLTSEDIQRVHDTATRVAAGAMNKDADKSFAQLAAESIVEEAVHNLNPYVMAKKSLAFGVGIVKGVGTAVGGLAKLGWEAVDTVGEALMVDMGFSGGGIFGTENLDSIVGMTETVGNNMNFDGVIKAVVAAGGAIDAKIKELGKGDIDWNTSEFGGEMVGENFIGPEVATAALGAGLSKARTLIKGGEEAAEVAAATERAAGAVGSTERTAGGVTGALDDTVRIPPPEGVKPPTTGVGVADDAATAGTKVEPRPFENAPPDSAPTKIQSKPGTIERPAAPPESAPTKIEPRPLENPPPESAPTKIEPKPGTVAKPGETASAPTKLEPGPGQPPTQLEPPPGTAPKPGELPKTQLEPPPKPGEMPPTQLEPAPGTVAKPAAAVDAAAAEAAEAAKKANRLERAGVDEFSEVSFVGPDGQTVTVKTGKELGHGSTSTVFADPTDPTKAIRITKPGGLENAGSARAPQLDAAGRKAVEAIQRPDGPLSIVKPGKPVMVNDPTSPLNGKVVETVERLKNGSADKFLQAQGGHMTPGQAEAFANATKELNNTGYAWMDNHTGNYGFKQLEGTDKWQVVVLDPGGIVPMVGETAAERIANATALQKALNAPEGGIIEMYNEADKIRKKTIIRLQRGQVMTDFADKIDTFAMGFKDPYEIGFYPAGTWQFPEVSKYFQ